MESHLEEKFRPFFLSVCLPLLGKAKINFYDVAAIMFDVYKTTREFDRQKEMNHLGIISETIEGANHTRYEYLMLQCLICDLMDNIHKGGKDTQGSISIDGEEYKGNAVIKSWFLLSNFGHAKNTIADEKTLINLCIERKGFKTKLLSPITDVDLKIFCESVIDSYQYEKFHYVLSIRRVYKEIKSKDIQALLIKLLKLLLVDTTKLNIKVNQSRLEQLKHVFKIVRKISIISLDTHNSHIPISINITSLLLAFDYFENKYKKSSINTILNPIHSMLYDEIYLKGSVQTRQRFYEVAAIEEIKKRAYTEYDNIVKEALDKGLYNTESCNFKHFARYTLPVNVKAKQNLLSELRNVMTVKRQCPFVEASLDFNPITKTKFIDFYYDQSKFTKSLLPTFVYNIALILQGQIFETVKNSPDVLALASIFNAIQDDKLKDTKYDEIKNKIRVGLNKSILSSFVENNMPTFRGLLWWVIKYFIGDNYLFDIDFHIKKHDFFSLKLINPNINFIPNQIEQAIKNESDKDRIHELEQLKSSALRKFDGFVFVCLSRIQIYDKTQAPGKMRITDIDSVVLKSNKDQFILEFHESKNTSSSRERKAIKDLKNNFVKILNSNAKGYRITPVKGKGAKLTISISK